MATYNNIKHIVIGSNTYSIGFPVTSVNSKTGAVSLTASDVGAATSGHTHTTSIATSTGTNQITLAHGSKYALTAGGTSYVFTMPSDNNTTYTFENGTNNFKVTPSGGTAQTVTVTPSITNNVTGSGTSGQLAQWNGTNTLTSGPKITYSTSTPSGGSNGDIWFVYS